MLNCCECEEADCVHSIPRFRAIDAIPIRFLFVVVRFTGGCPVAAGTPLTDLLYKYSSGTVPAGHGSTTMILERVANSAHTTEWERVSSITTVNGHRLYTYRLVAYNFGSIRFILNGSGTGYELDTGTSSDKCFCSNANPAKVLVHPATGYVAGNDTTYQKAFYAARVKPITDGTSATLTVTVSGGCFSGVAVPISLNTSAFTGYAPEVIDGYWCTRGRPRGVWEGSTYVPAIGQGVYGAVNCFGLDSHDEPESYGAAGYTALTHNAYVQASGQPCLVECSLTWSSHTSALTAYTGTLNCTSGGKTFDSSVSGSGV